MDLDKSTSTDLHVEIAKAAHTASLTGAGADVHAYRAATVVIDIDSWTDGSHAFSVEQSDDDITWAAVGSGFLSETAPTVDAAADVGKYVIGVTGASKFVRVTITVTGATIGAAYGAYIVASHETSVP